MAQYGPEVFTRSDGTIASGVPVRIFRRNVAAPATIFSDVAMTIPAPNPLITDGAGMIMFHAAPDEYWMHAEGHTFRVVGNDGLRQMSIDEDHSVILDRPTMVDPGTAEDLLKMQNAGTRTGYFNEFGEIRSRASANNRVAARFQAFPNAEVDNPTVHILEATLSDNTVRWHVTAAGDMVAVGTVAGSNTPPGAWVALALGVNVTSTGGVYPQASSRLDPLLAVVRLRGALAIGGAIAGDATLVTLTAGPPTHRPPFRNTYSFRTGGAGAVGTFLDIDPDGTISVRAAIGLNAEINLDGLTFPLA